MYIKNLEAVYVERVSFKMKKIICFILMLYFSFAIADENPLGPGDMLRITVYGNPDLSTDTRVTAAGTINFPLIGEVSVVGGDVPSVEKKIAKMLESGGYLKLPQVNVVVLQFSSLQVSVLGDVNKPGRYPLDKPSTLSEVLALSGGVSAAGSDMVSLIVQEGGKNKKVEYDLRSLLRKDGAMDVKVAPGNIVYVHRSQVSVLGKVLRPGKYSINEGGRTVLDLLANAGGLSQEGSDQIIVTTNNDGHPQQIKIDVDQMYKTGDFKNNVELSEGDSIYVPKSPVFYIYGEVQRPGAFRIERDMTVAQALATGGGLTLRGTERGLKIKRLNEAGAIETVEINASSKVQPDDVIYVQESLF